jgi:tetratricopeptide (TPR) repeat protein
MADSEINSLLEMGVLFAGSGQAARARTYFTKAVKMDPESAFAWYYLGAVLEDAERKQFCFTRAATLDPEIHQKVIQAYSNRMPPPPETEMVAAKLMEDPAIDEMEDTPIDRKIEPDPEPEPEPEIIEKNAPPKRKRLSLFMILLSTLLLVLILLAGAAYWFIVFR